MKLADFLKRNIRGDPPAGTVGVESDWLDVGTLQVTTGSLWAGENRLSAGGSGLRALRRHREVLLSAQGRGNRRRVRALRRVWGVSRLRRQREMLA